MASRAAGPSLRRAIHSSCTTQAGLQKPSFRTGARRGGSDDPQASTSGSKLVPGAAGASMSVDVSHLPVLSQGKVKESQVGTAMLYPDHFAKQVLDDTLPRSLRHDLSYTSKPTTVLRKATVSLAANLRKNKHLKAVLAGHPGTGRSTVLLQTVAHAQSEGWLVLHVADANQLVNGTYSFIRPKGDETVYDQPELSQLILKRFLATNSKQALDKLDSSVLQAIEKGSKEASSASAALQKLLESASDTSPIFVAVDAAEALYQPTNYRDVSNKILTPSRLFVPRTLRSCLAGTGAFSKVTALAALDKTSTLASGDLEHIELGALSRTEAAGIYQHLADTLLLETTPTDAGFLQAFVGSDGNAKIFSRGLRAIPGTTARGVIKKGRRRGNPVRNDKLHTVTVTTQLPTTAV